MSLLTVGRRRGTAPLPYTIPTTAPYNAPQHLTTPTYDGSGNTIHPDVIDFWTTHGIRQWNGYRFWMAHTPYPNTDDDYENPSILASHDGVTWVTPPGLTNPIYPSPASGWNSDTDLTYDVATGQLVLVFRGYDQADPFPHFVARSSDGTTWPATATRLSMTRPEENTSPALVRMSDGWAMWGVGYPSRTLRRWTATTPEGPWSGPISCSGLTSAAWHIDVCRIGEKLYALIDEGRESEPALDALTIASSTDGGLTWAVGSAPVITKGSGGWDSLALYRGTLQPHENGTHMRVWYSGRKGVGTMDSWHVGLTEIPLAEWPTPPA